MKNFLRKIKKSIFINSSRFYLEKFLQEAAGFPISESVIPYEPSRPFLYAFWVGILNTLKVSLIGIVFATIITLFLIPSLYMLQLDFFRRSRYLWDLLLGRPERQDASPEAL